MLQSLALCSSSFKSPLRRSTSPLLLTSPVQPVTSPASVTFSNGKIDNSRSGNDPDVALLVLYSRGGGVALLDGTLTITCDGLEGNVTVSTNTN